MKCTGNITADGSPALTERGFCYSSSNPTPTLDDSHIANSGIGTGTYRDTLTGLQTNTTYYIRAYATNDLGTTYSNEIKAITLTFTCGISKAIDFDKNTYTTVQMGSQCWFRENLKTTHYATGNPITEQLNTATSTSPLYYHANSDASNDATRGLLYNWYAAMNGSASSNSEPSGVQGICPTGWHLPSNSEISTMRSYVSSIGEYLCDGNSAYIAQALAGQSYWLSNSTSLSRSCCPGYNLSSNNSTNFNAIPAGTLMSGRINKDLILWSSTSTNSDFAKVLRLDYAQSRVNYTNDGDTNSVIKRSAASVRCVYDSAMNVSIPTLSTADVSNFGCTWAELGGTITDNGGAAISERGFCYSTSNSEPTIADSYIVVSSSNSTYTSSPSNLTENTTYYVRAYAKNSAGIGYGEVRQFTTPAGTVPTVEILPTTDVDASRIKIIGYGNVTDAGSAPVTSRGFYFSETNPPTLSDDYVTAGSGTGYMTATLTCLASNTTYYIMAYATNSVGTGYSSTVITLNTGEACNGTTSISDYDGNTYKTVSIGSQCWMAENLRTTHYANGTAITEASTETSTSTKYYYHALKGNEYDSLAGFLYNYPAVTGKAHSSATPSGIQGICPDGWHVPSLAEWLMLNDYLICRGTYGCDGNPSNICKSLASTTGWSHDQNGNSCAIGSDQSTNNSSGFNAYPNGVGSTGGDVPYGDSASYWCTTKPQYSDAYWIYMTNNMSGGGFINSYMASINYASKQSVRCVKNQ